MAKYNALGMIETFGLVFVLEAADAMVDAGVKAVKDMEGNLYSSVVIASPHPDLYKITERYRLDKLLPQKE